MASFAVVLLLVGTSLMLILNATEKTPRVRIDGDFGDWQGVTLTADAAGDVAAPNVDLVAYGVVSDGLYLSFYLETAEPLFAGVEARTARVFVDSDLDAGTGYTFSGLGADYLIELSGSRAKAPSGILYVFEADRAANDWNGFAALTAVAVRTDGGGVETQVPLFDANLEASDAVAVAFQAIDGFGNLDISDLLVSNRLEPLAVDFTFTSARVLERGLTHTLGTITLTPTSDTSVDIDSLTFRFTSTAGRDTLLDVQLGGHDPLPGLDGRFIFAGLDLVLKGTLTLDLTGELAPEAEHGRAIGFELVEVAAQGVIPTITNSGRPAYIEGAGSQIAIDGLFEDWASIEKVPDSDTTPVANPAVDIDEHATYDSAAKDRVYLYLKVKGDTILAGEATPSAKTQIGSPGEDRTGAPASSGDQQTAPLPVETGEDAIRVFFDTDGDSHTGYRTLGMPLGAEKMVEIKGVGGVITQRPLREWKGEAQAEWKWSEGAPAEAAAAGSEIELAGVAGDYYLHLTGWNLEKDAANAEAYVPMGARNPSNTITIDGDNTGSDEWDGDEDVTMPSDGDDGTLYLTWDDTYLYFGLTGYDMNAMGAQNALAINIDENPGVNDGSTDTHYDIAWGSELTGNDYKYDYMILVGNIDNGSNDYTGIKWGDYTSGSWAWTNNQGNPWANYVCNSGTTCYTELKVPRDIDNSGAIDSDEFPTGQDDKLAMTFTLVNTASAYVWGSLPNEHADDDVTYTKCYEWAEANSDIEDVWSEADLIPEFPTLALPVAGMVLLFGLVRRRRRRF